MLGISGPMSSNITKAPQIYQYLVKMSHLKGGVAVNNENVDYRSYLATPQTGISLTILTYMLKSAFFTRK